MRTKEQLALVEAKAKEDVALAEAKAKEDVALAEEKKKDELAQQARVFATRETALLHKLSSLCQSEKVLVLHLYL